MFISYAQNFEDVMLWRALRHVEKGFYIDIGAQDPVADSVSLAFYEHGWRGIHVEPVPSHAAALRRARPDETVIEAAVGTQVGVIDLFEIPETGLSTADAGIARTHAESGLAHNRLVVPCIGLSTVFDRAGNRDVHWLKIDVEGMESSVLRSWEPSTTRPWIVIVEATVPRSPEPSFADWEEVILALGYQVAYFDGLNRFYVSVAHLELVEAFSVPPNVFDAFSLSGFACNAFCEKIKEEEINLRAKLEEQIRSAARFEAESTSQIASIEHRNDEARRAERLIQETALATLREDARSQQVLAERASALAASLRDQVEDLSGREREVRRQLDAAIESIRTMALEQSEARAARHNAEAALRTALQDTQELGEEIRQLESASADRESHWVGVNNSLRAELDRVTFQAKRHSVESEERVKHLEAVLSALRTRHEAQVLLYLNEIADAEFRALQAPQSSGETQRQTPHRTRFERVTSNPIFNALAHLKQTTVKAAELVMDAPIFTRTNYQPTFAVNANGEYQLDDFLVLHDRAFVEAAYTAILRRSADPQGEAFYLSQIRSGETKSSVLMQILQSDEGKAHRTVISGLERHVRLTRLCELPVLGRLVAATFFLFNVNEHMRELRAFQNHVIRIAEEAQIIHESNMQKLRSIS